MALTDQDKSRVRQIVREELHVTKLDGLYEEFRRFALKTENNDHEMRAMLKDIIASFKEIPVMRRRLDDHDRDVDRLKRVSGLA
jgi:hypothetical protein